MSVRETDLVAQPGVVSEASLGDVRTGHCAGTEALNSTRLSRLVLTEPPLESMDDRGCLVMGDTTRRSAGPKMAPTARVERGLKDQGPDGWNAKTFKRVPNAHLRDVRGFKVSHAILAEYQHDDHPVQVVPRRRGRGGRLDDPFRHTEGWAPPAKDKRVVVAIDAMWKGYGSYRKVALPRREATKRADMLELRKELNGAGATCFWLALSALLTQAQVTVFKRNMPSVQMVKEGVSCDEATKWLDRMDLRNIGVYYHNALTGEVLVDRGEKDGSERGVLFVYTDSAGRYSPHWLPVHKLDKAVQKLELGIPALKAICNAKGTPGAPSKLIIDMLEAHLNGGEPDPEPVIPVAVEGANQPAPPPALPLELPEPQPDVQPDPDLIHGGCPCAPPVEPIQPAVLDLAEVVNPFWTLPIAVRDECEAWQLLEYPLVWMRGEEDEWLHVGCDAAEWEWEVVAPGDDEVQCALRDERARWASDLLEQYLWHAKFLWRDESVAMRVVVARWNNSMRVIAEKHAWVLVDEPEEAGIVPAVRRVVGYDVPPVSKGRAKWFQSNVHGTTPKAHRVRGVPWASLDAFWAWLSTGTNRTMLEARPELIQSGQPIRSGTLVYSTFTEGVRSQENRQTGGAVCLDSVTQITTSGGCTFELRGHRYIELNHYGVVRKHLVAVARLVHGPWYRRWFHTLLPFTHDRTDGLFLRPVVDAVTAQSMCEFPDRVSRLRAVGALVRDTLEDVHVGPVNEMRSAMMNSDEADVEQFVSAVDQFLGVAGIVSQARPDKVRAFAYH